jgi:hypothetical protein
MSTTQTANHNKFLFFVSQSNKKINICTGTDIFLTIRKKFARQGSELPVIQHQKK